MDLRHKNDYSFTEVKIILITNQNFKIIKSYNVSQEILSWHSLRHSHSVMVLLGLLGDVHKGNFTWNLKAFDEFQNLPNLPVRFETDFSFQDAEF